MGFLTEELLSCLTKSVYAEDSEMKRTLLLRYKKVRIRLKRFATVRHSSLVSNLALSCQLQGKSMMAQR